MGTTGIAQKMSWKLSFFGAACCVTGSGVYAVLYMIFHVSWAPITFLTHIYLLLLGLLMVVLDFPLPANKAPFLSNFRNTIFKFFLFMTRFTGRGAWYIFLGTMIWGALWNNDISPPFAILFATPVLILGAVALGRGYWLTNKLEQVKKCETLPPCSSNGLEKAQFAELSKRALKDKAFSNDELEYVINALSNSPQNDGFVSKMEWDAWMERRSATWV